MLHRALLCLPCAAPTSLMEILNKTHYDIGMIQHYTGICENCGTPHEYDGDLVVVHLQETETERIFIPIDGLYCPECGLIILRIRIHKSMNITEELNALKS